MSFALAALLAFACGAAYDALNVRFIRAAGQKRAEAAGLYSVLVGACALVGLGESIKDPWASPFLLAGYFVGTWAGVRWGK